MEMTNVSPTAVESLNSRRLPGASRVLAKVGYAQRAAAQAIALLYGLQRRDRWSSG